MSVESVLQAAAELAAWETMEARAWPATDLCQPGCQPCRAEADVPESCSSRQVARTFSEFFPPIIPILLMAGRGRRNSMQCLSHKVHLGWLDYWHEGSTIWADADSVCHRGSQKSSCGWLPDPALPSHGIDPPGTAFEMPSLTFQGSRCFAARCWSL